MANRYERLELLEKTAKEYIKREKARIENEVSVLEAVLRGRTGGAGIQSKSTSTVAAVAQSDLTDYLKGG